MNKSHTTSLADKIPDMLLHGAGGAAIKSVIIYDVTTRIIPRVVGSITKWIAGRFEKRAKRICNDMLKMTSGTKQEKTAIMILDRNFKLNGSTNDMFDAVLSIASDVVEARFIRRTAKGIFVIDTSNEIRIAPDIYFKKMSILEQDGDLENMSVQVFSFTKDIVALRTYLNNIEIDYLKNKGNQLGRQLYYFDELPVAPPYKFSAKDLSSTPPSKPEYDLSKSLPSITFNMFALHTNKSLKNLYGECARNAKKRVEFFINNPQWYADRGIPHTLGILMHGAPGCGKTSFIKAVARDTGRHVVNIKMGPTTTVQQINNLFYTPRLSVIKDGATQTYDIPMDKRIIVMEDVDCLSCVVRDTPDSNADPNQLNLGILLNILDGVLETPGRIVIMTTNAPEKLDSALKRPGRIDVNIEFKKCSVQDTIEMIEGITGWQVPATAADLIANETFTPAEVTKTIFENLDDPTMCLKIFENKPQPLPILTPIEIENTVQDDSITFDKEKEILVYDIDVPNIWHPKGNDCAANDLVIAKNRMLDTDIQLETNTNMTLEQIQKDLDSSISNNEVCFKNTVLKQMSEHVNKHLQPAKKQEADYNIPKDLPRPDKNSYMVLADPMRNLEAETFDGEFFKSFNTDSQAEPFSNDVQPFNASGTVATMYESSNALKTFSSMLNQTPQPV